MGTSDRNKEFLLAQASAKVNAHLHRFPWKRDGAIVHLTVTPLAESPDTPAWYHPASGDVSINLAVIYTPDRVGSVLSGIDLGSDIPHVIMGMIAHETAHSRWSNWTPPPGASAATVQVMTLFEELRIEKRAADWRMGASTPVAGYPSTMLRGSFRWLLEQLVKAPLNMDPLSLGHTWALTFGRYIASIATIDEVRPVDTACRTALSDDTVDTMREILEEAIITDNTFRVAELADEWLALLKPEGAEDEGKAMPGLIMHGAPEGEAKDPGDPSEGGEDEEMADVLAQSIEEVAEAVKASDALPSEVKTRDPAEMAAKVFGHGRSGSGGASWTTRPPDPALRQTALRLSRTLEQLSLPSVSLRHTPSTLPPGRLRGREAVRQGAERSMGLLSTATPWERSKRQRTHNKPVIVGTMTDVSGSMRYAQKFVADFAWVMAVAGQRVGARTAAVTFGEKAEMVTRPDQIPQVVRERRSNGGEEAFDQAAAAIEGVLHLSVQTNAAKVLFIVSDGQFVIPYEQARAALWLERWTMAGVLVVWLGGDSNCITKINKRVRAPGKVVNIAKGGEESMMRTMETAVIAAARTMA